MLLLDVSIFIHVYRARSSIHSLNLFQRECNLGKVRVKRNKFQLREDYTILELLRSILTRIRDLYCKTLVTFKWETTRKTNCCALFRSFRNQVYLTIQECSQMPKASHFSHSFRRFSHDSIEGNEYFQRLATLNNTRIR